MPAQVLNVTVDDAKARAYLDKVVKELPTRAGNITWNLTQIAASSIKEEAGSAFSFPRPYLVNTIKPKLIKEKKEYAVMSAKHGPIVERGRGPGKMPPPLGIIDDWARKAGMSSYALRKSIAEKGTRGRHFIRNGLIKAQPRFNSYIQKEARRLME